MVAKKKKVIKKKTVKKEPKVNLDNVLTSSPAAKGTGVVASDVVITSDK